MREPTLWAKFFASAGALTLMEFVGFLGQAIIAVLTIIMLAMTIRNKSLERKHLLKSLKEED